MALASPRSQANTTPCGPHGPAGADQPAERTVREDILRAKRSVLQVALELECRAFDHKEQAGLSHQLRPLCLARRYLLRPEDTLVPLSDEEEEHVLTKDPPHWRESPPASANPSGRMVAGSSLASGATTSSLRVTFSTPSLPSKFRPDATSKKRSTSASGGARTGSQSQSDYLRSLGVLERSFKKGSAWLPHIRKGLAPKSAFHAADQAAPPRREPLVSAWWAQRWSFNVSVGGEGGKRGLTAYRQDCQIPGGAAVVGNGILPLFRGSHIVCPGYFFAFQVEAVDDAHGGGLSLGVGVSRNPVRQLKERCLYAYEIPDAVLVGYGGHLVDAGQWTRVAWDPRGLSAGDVVGLLVLPFEGDLVVFVNGKQVLRMATSLADDAVGGPQGHAVPMEARSLVRLALWPVVDLCGRVSAVSLLPNLQPPSVQINRRDRPA